jgi:hypothetical protein
MATLGISTNTRLLGIAIIKEGVLLDYSIRLHKSSWSPTKATEIITSLEPCVRQYCIKRVSLSIPHAHHQTEAFRMLISSIRRYFEERNIPVIEVSAKEIHTICPEGQKKSKKALMKTLCDLFPSLSFCYRKEMRNKNKYYIKVFEAVAVALLYKQKK